MQHGRIQGKREGGKVLQSERSTQAKAGNGRKPGLAGTECAREGNSLDGTARARLWRGLKDVLRN